MTEQIVDIVEANMPVSSDVEAAAKGAGAAAGEYAGTQSAKTVCADLTARVDANTARISNIVASPTPADGELADIRVTVDGQTLPTAGDAVRAQADAAVRRIGHTAVTSTDYNDLNLLPNQSVLTFGKFEGVANTPTCFDRGTVLTVNSNDAHIGQVQICSGPPNRAVDKQPCLAYRVCWYQEDRWSPWTIIDPTVAETSLRARDTKILTVADVADLDELDAQQILTFGKFDGIEHAPEGFTLGGTMITANGLGATGIGQVQIIVDAYGHLAYRAMWRLVGNWSDWTIIDAAAIHPPQTQWASIAMFERFAVIGDSYASGEIFLSNTAYQDYYPLSWGQIIARRNGIECQNLSQGGLTTRSWLTKPHGLPLMQSSDPAQLYIIALGINDAATVGYAAGSLDDIDPSNPDTNPDTFCGNYGRIIAAVRAHAPHAKIIVMTMARTDGQYGVLNDLIRGIGTKLGLPVINQSDDPFFTSDAYLNHMVRDHPTAVTYSGMATAIERLFARCATDNINYFRNYVG